MKHFRMRRFFSAYLDGELDEAFANRVREHLTSCATCRAAYQQVVQGAHMASQFDQSPLPNREQLWAGIGQRLESGNRMRAAGGFRAVLAAAPRWVGTISPAIRRPAMMGALTVLLAANLVVIYKILYSPQAQRAEMLSHYDFDYGIYLDAVSRDREPTQFDQLYHSEPVEYESAGASISFALASYALLSQDYEITDARLLKTACCHSVQCSISSGHNEIVLFQQPQEHPFTFGRYKLERTLIGGRWFHVSEAGKYQVVSWVTSTSKIVLVGESIYDELPRLIALIEQS